MMRSIHDKSNRSNVGYYNPELPHRRIGETAFSRTAMYRRWKIVVFSIAQYFLIWSQVIRRHHSWPVIFAVQGQIISVVPGIPPSESPSASPTVYSIKVAPVPTVEPIVPSFAPFKVEQPSITFAPIPVAPEPVTLPPWMLPSVPTTNVPSSVPSIEATTAVPVLSIVNGTTSVPGGAAPSPTTNTLTTNREGSNLNFPTILGIVLPIMIVTTILLCVGIYCSYRPKRMRRKKGTDYNNACDGIAYDFDPDRPDGGNSVFDDASIYTSSVIANFKNSRNNSNTSIRESGMSSVGGVINQDFTEATDPSNDDFHDNDDDENTEPGTNDHFGDLAVENHTIASNSAVSTVTPNSFENQHIGYMEEGMMIQERYDRINKELYSSERTSPQSDTTDIIRHAQSLLVSHSMKQTNVFDSKSPTTPKSDEGVEVTFRKDNSVQYDDIVGIDNTSTMSYGTSNGGSPKISGDIPTDPSTSSVKSAKIFDLLSEANLVSTELLHDFDDPVAASRIRTTQPQQHHPLASIALFKRGRSKKGPFGKSNSSKIVDNENNMSQYKTDEPYPMMVPSMVEPMSNDDQNSSLIEPFSEITTDFHFGEHGSIGSNDAHIVLESVKEGTSKTGISSSCDSSVNYTHVFENDNDSINTPLPFHNNQRRGGDRDTSEDYNLHLPLDFEGYDERSANSQFDKLYESMSNEWEWKQPSQTIGRGVVGSTNENTSRKDKNSSSRSQGSKKSTGSLEEDVVRELGNIFLV